MDTSTPIPREIPRAQPPCINGIISKSIHNPLKINTDAMISATSATINFLFILMRLRYHDLMLNYKDNSTKQNTASKSAAFCFIQVYPVSNNTPPLLSR